MIDNHTLVIRGDNNTAYRKPVGSSSSWKQIYPTKYILGIAGKRYTFNEDPDQFYVTGSDREVYSYELGQWDDLGFPNSLDASFLSGAYDLKTLTYYKKLYSFQGCDSWAGCHWESEFSGSQKATDLVTTSNGTWLIGDNNRIYFLDNNGTMKIVSSGHGISITVSNDGTVYIIGTNNKIYKLVTS